MPRNRLESRSWDILAGLLWFCQADPLEEACEAFRKLSGRQNIFFAPSGRCAIAQVLAALPQKEVVIPACTCGVVKTAAEIAGKRIIYVDLAKGAVNATSAEYAEAAKPGRILLATHLFGIPTDIEAICELAKARNCVVVEDAVAAFGGQRNGRPLGTFGDVGVFSFQYAKRLSAFGGAAIIVNNEVLDASAISSTRVAKQHRIMPFRDLVKGLVHNLATSSLIYGKLTMPLLSRKDHHDRTAEDTQEQTAPINGPAYTREFHPYQAELVLRLLKRIDRTRERIAQLVAIYLESFSKTEVISVVPSDCDEAGLLRFPIAIAGRDRDEVLDLGLERGLFLSGIYQLLPDKSDHTRFPNAVWAARNLVLLPLFSGLSPQSAARLAREVSRLV